ncbi:MAG TPA: CocE/NonD family hydrolase [Candidatus Micrarchaeia archaeon]|nr:CocE/NonD family hydrolase [Candidatus Micrarchaeia archaeon]
MGARHRSLPDRLVRRRLASLAAGARPDHLGVPPAPGALWDAADIAGAPLPDVATTVRGRSPDGGAAVVDFSFASRGAGTHPGSRTVRGRLFRAADPLAPCVVLVHGLAADRPAFEERLARREWRWGRSALHLVLPAHGSRRLPGRRSGDAFLCADPAATRANLVQATLDAVDCVRWLREQGTRHVGMVGFSLGGLVACLAATRTRLERMVAVTPPADLAWTGTRLVVEGLRRSLGLDRVSPAVAEEQLRGVIPRFLTPCTRPEDIGLLAAGRDEVVGSGPVLELARAWGVGRTWLVPRGHLTALVGWGRAGELVAFAQGQAAPRRRPLPLAPASAADAPLL